MLKKVKEYAARWDMIKETDKIVVGVSGGADSICLLFVLLELQQEIPFELIAVHVNHGIRGEDAKRDELYVQNLCRKYQIPCVTYHENVELIAKNRKQSTEEAGRDVRRACFQEVMKQMAGTKIALAHHQNDNAETFFMNLARGTGIKGMGGIRPVSGEFIRPLLCVSRNEIEAYLAEKQIVYCMDQTNTTDDYTRNRIRNRVIPYLEAEVNANVVSHVNETMEQLQQVWKLLEAQTKEAVQMCTEKREEAFVVMENAFLKVPQVLQPFVLRDVLVKVTGKEKDIESAHLKQIQELFAKQAGKKIDLPYNAEAKRVYEGICIQTKGQDKREEFEEIIELHEGETKEVVWKKNKIRLRFRKDFVGSEKSEQKGSTKWFDCGIIKNGISVRTRKPGDYITIHPDGHTQKLKSYFINEKIPQEKRDEILLVADGSHILWVLGYRAGCTAKINENTKHVLEIQMIEGEYYGREH